VVVFLAVGFLGAVFFAAVGFLAGAALLAVVFVVAFFAEPSLTPASFAVRASVALRRAAVFFGSRFFFTIVSISLWTFDREAALGFAVKAFKAVFRSRFCDTLRSRRFDVWRIRLIADLMIGTLLVFLLFRAVKTIR